MTNPNSPSSHTYSLSFLSRIFIPFALGYFLSYLYRVVNTVIAGDLSNDIGVDAAQLGLLTSAYLITFAAFQLPLGILLDRFGPRRVEASLLLFAALGAALFALADSLGELIVGRALIGFGVSACLMAAFKAFTQWFPKDKLPLVNGLQFASGGLGMLAATVPVEWTLQFTDWRGVFWILAAATLVIAGIIFFTVPDSHSQHSKSSLKEHISGILHIFTHRQFWSVAPWSVATQATFLSIIGLWSGPWLRDVADFSRDDVAATLSWLAIGVIAGYALMGIAAERLARVGLSNTALGAIGMGLFMLIQLGLIFELTSWSMVIWFAYGFFGTTGALTYAHLSQQFPVELSGRVNTALNLLVFVFGFLGQWLVGVIINHYSQGNTERYSADGYQVAFIALLVIQVVAMLAFFWQQRRSVR